MTFADFRVTMLKNEMIRYKTTERKAQENVRKYSFTKNTADSQVQPFKDSEDKITSIR